MRSLRPTAHGRLTRWFYVLLNARHGVLLGIPIAAGLLTVLVARPYPHDHEWGNGVALYYILRDETMSTAQTSDPSRSKPDFFTEVRILTYSSPFLSLRGSDSWSETLRRGQAFFDPPNDRRLHVFSLTSSYSDPASPSVYYSSGRVVIGNTWHREANPGGVNAAVALRAAPVISADGYMVFYFAPIITTTLDSVVTEYQGQMMYSSASTLMAQVVRDTPSANYFSTLASFGGDTERRRLMQPIITGVQPAQAGAGTTLSDLAAFFRPDKPITVVAELDATTFQKEPAEPQRILFNPRVPISFTWNIKPLEEREQDLTVNLFLEGIPVNGTEPQRVPISSTTVHTYVNVPVVSYGPPIAIYTAVYAALTFILGGLATWGVPRIYVWALTLHGRRKPRSAPVRRGTTRIAVAARRHARKAPGRREM